MRCIGLAPPAPPVEHTVATNEMLADPIPRIQRLFIDNDRGGRSLVGIGGGEAILLIEEYEDAYEKGKWPRFAEYLSARCLWMCPNCGHAIHFKYDLIDYRNTRVRCAHCGESITIGDEPYDRGPFPMD